MSLSCKNPTSIFAEEHVLHQTPSCTVDDRNIFVTVFGKTDRLARKTKIFYVVVLPFKSSKDATVQL